MTGTGSVARTVALRVVRLLAVLLVVSALCFLSLSLLPGDPAQAILGESGSPDAIAALQHQLGLDQPLVVRYVTWLGNVLHGNLGASYFSNQPVSQIIAYRAPITLELIALSQIIALVVAVPLAVVAAAKRGSAVDRGLSLGVFTVLSTPNFVAGFLLIWIFAVKLGWFPANGYVPWSQGVLPHLGSMFLPALALAAAPFALYQRVLRADLVETYDQEFMHVARAKGVSPVRAAFHHAMRPSMLGLTTALGVTIGTLIGADVIIESLFSIPGIGAELAHAVSGRDYIEVQGLVLVITTTFVLVNALVDVIYVLIDPRLKAGRTQPAGALR
jgi:peptide/nickel transport system permease protein